MAKKMGVIATEEQTVAENTGILSKIKSIAATVWKTTVTGLHTAAIWIGSTALAAYTLAETFLASATLAGVGAKIASTAATVWKTIVTWADFAATVALEVASWLLTAAMIALGVAVIIATSPITLIVIAVLALIAAWVAIIYYFEEIDAWISDLTGGFVDLWDILLVGIPVIGWMILSWKHLDDIINIFNISIDYLGNLFTQVWDGVVSGFNYINTAVQGATGGFFDFWDVLL